MKNKIADLAILTINYGWSEKPKRQTPVANAGKTCSIDSLLGQDLNLNLFTLWVIETLPSLWGSVKKHVLQLAGIVSLLISNIILKGTWSADHYIFEL